MKMNFTRQFESVQEFKEAFEQKTARGLGWDLDYDQLGIEERERLEESVEKTYDSQVKINWNGLELTTYFGAPLYEAMIRFCDYLLEEEYE